MATGKRAAPRHSGNPGRSEHSGQSGHSGHSAHPGQHSGHPAHSGHPHLDASGIPPLRSRRSNGPLLLLALGITAAVVAWGYLVYLAIDFGTTARNGDGRAWWFLALATIGAIACLFFALMLGTRLVGRLREGARPSGPPRPPGGRRAAR